MKRFLVIFLAVAVVFNIWLLPAIYVTPVLMYHHIDENSKMSKLSVSPESFRRQMEFLRRNRYNVISLDEYVGLKGRSAKVPKRTVVVTFDDGWRDNWTNAYPILKEHKIPATVFLETNAIGQRATHISWDEARQMAEGGISMGAHSRSHAWLPGIKDDNELRDEILGSKQVIEEKIGKAVSLFSYPTGAFDKRVRQAVIDAGCKGAVATNPGRKYPKDDIFAIKRIRISRTSDNLFVFWIETSGYYTWLKEHRDED